MIEDLKKREGWRKGRIEMRRDGWRRDGETMKINGMI